MPPKPRHKDFKAVCRLTVVLGHPKVILAEVRRFEKAFRLLIIGRRKARVRGT
jgi:hypothetical protein